MRTFFVLAMGRSGTHFLSGLLSTDPRGIVHHEPHHLDPILTRLRQGGGVDAALDLELDRRFDGLLERAGSAAFYGEVNSYLRQEVPYLSRRFPQAPLLHLVRDGRAFVRSAWPRGPYTPAEGEGPLLPRDDDPVADRWGSFDRFGKLCWAWTHANETLARGIPSAARFEDLLSDYGVFRERILEPTGVRVDEATWRHAIARPSNTSRQFMLRNRVRRLVLGRGVPPLPPLPPYGEWGDERRRVFREICGDTMRRFGYEP